VTFNEFLSTRYGAGVTKISKNIKDTKCKMARSKNQMIFLQRCISNNVVPKSFRIRSPLKNKNAHRLNRLYRIDLLINAKNDAKKRFFKSVAKIKTLEAKLENKVLNEDLQLIVKITDTAKERTFLKSKMHLKKKFEDLLNNTPRQHNLKETNVKPVVLNLSEKELPPHHKDLLNLGPQFVPTSKRIPYMDIITSTEAAALKITYENKKDETKAQTLRQDVLRAIKMTKTPKTNMTKENWKAIKEIKADSDTSIYPYDKGAGLVRIDTISAKERIREQIGNTTIIQEDPTTKITRKVQTVLPKLKKLNRFTQSEYKKLYPTHIHSR